MILWRPVGQAELKLIEKSGWQAFPTRLVEQPVFYPDLNFPHAEQLAFDWDSKTNSHEDGGFVTEFEVDDTYLARFQAETGKINNHSELWVPADKLAEFNTHIIGKIDVVATYRREERT